MGNKTLLDDGLRVTSLISPRYLTKWNIGFSDISPFFEAKKTNLEATANNVGAIIENVRKKQKQAKQERRRK